jgi:hypothetical protein
MMDNDSIPPVERRSLVKDAEQEAQRERWYQSEAAGYDVGEQAHRNWVRQHWRGFVLARWVEHLQGNRFWIELNRADFGLLRDMPAILQPHFGELLELLRSGSDNLNVVRWTTGKSPEARAAIIDLLSKIQMNSMRLPVPFQNEDSA